MLEPQTGLVTSYGPTNWVSEQLVCVAGQRKTQGSTIRPGFIRGGAETGVSNADDFLVWVLKGCRAPEPDDRNTVAVLKADDDRYTGVDESMGCGVSREDVGRYLRFLTGTKYISAPSETQADTASAEAASGRSGS